MRRRFIPAAVRAGLLRWLRSDLAALHLGLHDPAVWRRAAILACLRDRLPDLLTADSQGSAALADRILSDALGDFTAASSRCGRAP